MQVVPVQFLYFGLCVPSLLFLGLAWRLPESPVWLMRSGREAEARLTLEWLRGKKYDTLPEMEELRAVTQEKEAGRGPGAGGCSAPSCCPSPSPAPCSWSRPCAG